MGWFSDVRALLSEMRRRHPITFFVAALAALLVVFEGLLAISAYALPQDFCIAETFGNCWGVLAGQSAAHWAGAKPLSLQGVVLSAERGNATVRNVGAEPVKLERVSLVGADDPRLAYEFSGAELLQPGGEIEVALVSEKDCPGEFLRFDVMIGYVSSQGASVETGKRLFVKCMSG